MDFGDAIYAATLERLAIQSSVKDSNGPYLPLKYQLRAEMRSKQRPKSPARYMRDITFSAKSSIRRYC